MLDASPVGPVFFVEVWVEVDLGLDLLDLSLCVLFIPLDLGKVGPEVVDHGHDLGVLAGGGHFEVHDDDLEIKK